MTAERTELRQDIVARLKASAAITALVPAARIFDSRSTRIDGADLPAVNVFVPQTKRRRRGPGLPFFDVHHAVGIDCLSKGDADDELSRDVDTIAEAVLEALFTDPAFVCKWSGFENVDEAVALDAESDGRKGFVRITFEAVSSRQYDPVVVDDLKTIDVDIDQIRPETNEPDGTSDVELTLDGLDEL